MAAVEAATGKMDASLVRPWLEVSKGYTRFQEGDVIVAKITPCMENGKFALAKNLAGGRAAGSTEFHVLRPSEAILPEYVLNFVLQQSFRHEARANMRGAAGQLRVPPEFLAEAPIPIPPVNEQRRIVAAIETQFTRLDAAVAALERVKSLIARYKSSVIQAAVSGRLFTNEKATNQTLARHQLSFVEAKAPQNWEVADLPAITFFQEGPGLRNWQFRESGMKVVNVRNILPSGRLDTSNTERHIDLDEFQKKYSHFAVDEGDILLASSGSIGKTARARHADLPLMLNTSVVRFRSLDLDRLVDEYLLLFLRSSQFLGQVDHFVTGTAQKNFGPSHLKRMQILIPPLAEQHRIVAEVERRLSVVEEMEKTIDANLKRAERLRQAILARAFTGKLVPQDPSDEPASVLLERIRADRAATGVSNHRSQRQAHPRQRRLIE